MERQRTRRRRQKLLRVRNRFNFINRQQCLQSNELLRDCFGHFRMKDLIFLIMKFDPRLPLQIIARILLDSYACTELRIVNMQQHMSK